MKGSLKRPRVVSKIHYLDYNGEDVLSTPDAMENDFGIRRLLHWHLLGVH
jgi:hypothetical protein